MSDGCNRCGEKEGLFYVDGEPYCREHVPEAMTFEHDARVTELEEEVEALRDIVTAAVGAIAVLGARVDTLEDLAGLKGA